MFYFLTSQVFHNVTLFNYISSILFWGMHFVRVNLLFDSYCVKEVKWCINWRILVSLHCKTFQRSSCDIPNIPLDLGFFCSACALMLQLHEVFSRGRRVISNGYAIRAMYLQAFWKIPMKNKRSGYEFPRMKTMEIKVDKVLESPPF